MGSTSAPNIGDEVVCRYDGRNRRARVTRVIDSNVIDVAIIDDAGNILGRLREVSRATDVDQRARELKWWPTPYGLEPGLVGGAGGKGGRARVGGVGIAIGGLGGKGGPFGPGGDGGDAEIDTDGIALGGEGGEAGQRDRGGRGGRNPLEAHGFPDIQLPDGSRISAYGRGGDGGSARPEPTDEPDRVFARMAIEQARECTAEDERARPRVGAVVVRDGRVLGCAYRGELGPGEHSEFTLLEKKLGDQALVGSTVYVTLEPCTTRNHPKICCAERLLERRVARVVIGMVDPDPRITGRGIIKLREGRIEVAFFAEDLAAEVEELNRHWVRSIREISKANENVAFAPSAREAVRENRAPATSGDDRSTTTTADAVAATSSRTQKLPRLDVVYGAMLGQGAFGSVWEATDILNRKVAVKLLTSTDEAFDEEALLRNARTLAQLSHPNLVTVYGAGLIHHPENGLLTPGLLMEFLPGEPLSKWATVRHEREHAFRVASDVLQGLQAIHVGGLHHGDLHAMNVMVLPDSRARVIDWRHQDTFLAMSAASRADVIAADRRAAIDVICSMFEKQGLSAEARKLERATSVADALAIVELLRTSGAPTPRRRRWIITAVTLLVIGLVTFAVKLLLKRSLPFATVIPQTHSQNLELMIWNEGDEPLTGVAAKIICYSCSPIASEPEINIGAIPARGFRELKPSFSPHLGADGIATYMILISDLNGQVVEGLQFRPGHNSLPWAFSYQVSRHVPRDNGDGTTTTHPEVLKQATWSDDLGDGKLPE